MQVAHDNLDLTLKKLDKLQFDLALEQYKDEDHIVIMKHNKDEDIEKYSVLFVDSDSKGSEVKMFLKKYSDAEVLLDIIDINCIWDDIKFELKDKIKVTGESFNLRKGHTQVQFVQDVNKIYRKRLLDEESSSDQE